jgi:hypothetical protein
VYNMALVQVSQKQMGKAKTLLESYLQLEPGADNADAVKAYIKTLPAN